MQSRFPFGRGDVMRGTQIDRVMKMAAFFAALGLTGCQTETQLSTPVSAASEVPVPVVLNTIKCDVARYIQDRTAAKHDKLGVKGGTIKATLTLNVTVDKGVSANIDAGKLIAFTGGTAGLGLGGSVNRKRTVTTEFVVGIESKAVTAGICTAPNRERMDTIGLYAWLTASEAQLSALPAMRPYAWMSGLSYITEFGITAKSNADASFGFVPIEASLSATYERNDVQTVKIEFTPSATAAQDRKNMEFRGQIKKDFKLFNAPELK